MNKLAVATVLVAFVTLLAPAYAGPPDDTPVCCACLSVGGSVNSTLVSAIFCVAVNDQSDRAAGGPLFRARPDRPAALPRHARQQHLLPCRVRRDRRALPGIAGTGGQPAQSRDVDGERSPRSAPCSCTAAAAPDVIRGAASRLVVDSPRRARRPRWFRRHPGRTAGSSRATRVGSDVIPGNFATGDSSHGTDRTAAPLRTVENEAQRIFALQRAGLPPPSVPEPRGAPATTSTKLERILVDNADAIADAINNDFGHRSRRGVEDARALRLRRRHPLHAQASSRSG